jgi:hypothetical protein
MGKGCGGEALVGYFTLIYYSPPPKIQSNDRLCITEGESYCCIGFLNLKPIYIIYTLSRKN